MTETPNWQQVIAELRAFGIGLKAIAHKTGASIRNLYDLEQGNARSPRYEVGVALLDLLRKTKA